MERGHLIGKPQKPEGRGGKKTKNKVGTMPFTVKFEEKRRDQPPCASTTASDEGRDEGEGVWDLVVGAEKNTTVMKKNLLRMDHGKQ